MTGPLDAQFPGETGVSPEERATSTEPFALAGADAPPAALRVWSDYVPFETGSKLALVAKAFFQSFDGTGTLTTLTDQTVGFQLVFPGPLSLQARISAELTYLREGPGNRVNLVVSGRKISQANVTMISTAADRTITAGKGLTVPTGVAFPSEITLTKMRIRKEANRVEIDAEIGDIKATVVVTAG